MILWYNITHQVEAKMNYITNENIAIMAVRLVEKTLNIPFGIIEVLFKPAITFLNDEIYGAYIKSENLIVFN